VRGRGGEESANVAARALAALADLPATPVAVVVTHGGTAGRLIERLLELGPQHRRVFGPLANCAWTELAAQGTRWRVMQHNSSVRDHVDAPGEQVPAARTASVGDAEAVA
jgi:probable phosphoglycerate mutase